MYISKFRLQNGDHFVLAWMNYYLVRATWVGFHMHRFRAVRQKSIIEKQPKIPGDWTEPSTFQENDPTQS